jgi:disulfide bond formation protein DsbB
MRGCLLTLGVVFLAGIYLAAGPPMAAGVVLVLVLLGAVWGSYLLGWRHRAARTRDDAIEGVWTKFHKEKRP